MVVAIARAHGLDVFTNPSTANIEQGFFSTVVRQANLFGKVPGSIAILEMDEGHAALVVEKVKPKTSVILNVFEDQLDRFVDPALVREKLLQVAKATYGTVVLNADDQNCLMIAEEARVTTSFFGLGKNLLMDVGDSMSYAPTYQSELKRPEISSEAISLIDKELRASILGSQVSVELPSRGVHFALDALAALSCSKEILGEKFDLSLATAVLNDLPPVFSRGEIRQINGEPCEFILVQNPISMQLNIDNLPREQDQVFFAIGRDVHDPSWMWTVDFKAIDAFFALPAPQAGIKTVIYSADAMRRLRRHLGFTDPEDVERV
jgi:UDP-N-acetylmuramyl pentapeptide synthase